APFPNIKRPIKTKKRRQNLKLLSIFSLIFWTSLLCFKVKNTSYINCGFLSLMLQTYQKFYLLKEIYNMKKHYSSSIHFLGIFLIALSSMMTRSCACLLWGEPDIPKSMLK
ncbi:accessory gene regulator B family protein, partial [Clostridium haemolyticum]|uniref:accessory gene regulator B family protein n=1 Tax=Clostridium haemolyticum TaxID=84025 RepID=UPI00177C924C